MKHFIFDIGGVLVDYNQDRMIQYLSAKHHKPVPVVSELFTYERLSAIETGKMTTADYYQNYIKKILNCTFDEWIQAYMDNSPLIESGITLLRDLKEKGNSVYLLSNQAEYNRTALEKKYPFFYTMCTRNFLSFEMGLYKPGKEIYLAACNAIGTDPGQCVFFDDVKENVKGAIGCGLKGIRFSDDRIGKIRKWLEI